MDGGWRKSFSYGFELVCTWFNSGFGQPESEICHVLTSKDTLGQIDLDIVFD